MEEQDMTVGEGAIHWSTVDTLGNSEKEKTVY